MQGQQGWGQDTVHTSSRETDDKDTWERLRCEDVTGQGGGQLTQNQEGGRGGFFAESFFRNQREGRWLVLGGIEAQSWGLRMGRE